MTLLEWAGISNLAERRLRLVDKFLQKAINNPVHSMWFPLKEFTHHDLRTEKIFEEKYAKTERLYKSPLYFYRRRLNTTGMLPNM